MHGIYIGWLGEQNLGDEAMLDACRLLLPEVTWTGIERLYRAPQDLAQRALRWRHALARTLGRERALLGGGTILNRNLTWVRQYELVRARVARPVPVFSPGVADPELWSRADGWETTLPHWGELLAELPVVGVRGPLSKRLLDEAGFAHVVVSGDPALALDVGAPPAPPPGRRNVIVNAGRARRQMWGDEDAALREVAGAVRELAGDGWDVRILPVWHEDVATCRAVAEDAGLPGECVLPLDLDALRVMRVLQGADIVVGFKLHASVLAAAAGVPFVALEYRTKVRDFAQSIAWEDEVVRTDTVTAAAIVERVRRLHAESADARERLSAAVTRVRADLRDYAAAIAPLLR